MTHAVEGACLIIASSLITLRPLFRGIKARVNDLSGTSKQSTCRHSGVSGKGFAAASSNQSQVECIISTRPSHDGTVWDDHRLAGLAELEGDIYVEKRIEVFVSDAGPKAMT